jgi:hypothetical protein
MYLYDRVAQSGAESLVEDAAGRIHAVPGPAELAEDVRGCGSRYVLDDSVRDTCLELLCGRPEVIQLADHCYRLPHEAMWIEWTDPHVVPGSSAGSQRAGVLVLADECGRRGTLYSFSQDELGRPWTGQVFFLFDFDQEISAEDALCGISLGDVGNPDEIKRIFRHGMPRIDNRWLDFFRASGGLPGDSLQRLMYAALPDFGMLCAFLLLLSLECAATQPRQGLDKINRARARSGKTLLLDHLEVNMRLAGGASGEGGGGHRGDRSAPRLHQVRGHLVRRGGKTFWRMHHLRGDAAQGIIASRMARVGGNGAMLRSAIG